MTNDSAAYEARNQLHLRFHLDLIYFAGLLNSRKPQASHILLCAPMDIKGVSRADSGKKYIQGV